jgi:hypothetical protein
MAMRKKVDFYLWMGIPVARSWPQYRDRYVSPEELVTRQTFQAAVKITGGLSDEVVYAFRAMMTGRGATWVDMQRAMTMGHSWITANGA